jgi:polyketide synthase PksN
LKSGRDCITEIPEERWDYRRYRSYEERCRWGDIEFCHWGGFIDDVDKFDAAFFNIQPLQAQCLDPQERLFLQTTWQLLESAGHTRARLREEYNKRVGVYVGSMYHDYSHIEADLAEELGSFLSFHSSIANRVSHFLDLNGPSLALDTMCSSSAVAIHTACRDLRHGDCDLAIAGGVNLSLHHKKFIGLSHEKQVGTHLGSRSFADANGYLPAEAVGAVLLKPLAKAIAARDRILGIIKSTAVNHGGRFNGYTMPNPTAQAQVIEECLARADVEPRTISYIEATSNGSMLGDPAEFVALHRVFSKHTAAAQFCPIGTVKSNIGHAEAASAVTQLAKVLLQFEHRQLPRSIKAEPLNPTVQWLDSFRLVSELQEWSRPTLNVDGREQRYPRRALVNSFGAGGTNASLLLEEFVEPRRDTGQPGDVPTGRPELIVFSARTADRLPVMLRQAFEHLQRNPQISLTDIAYTLQVGREEMGARVALVISSREELLSVLEQSLSFDPRSDATVPANLPLCFGDSRAASAAKGLLDGNAGKAMVEVLIRENDVNRLAQLWTQGVPIPWSQLHVRNRTRMLSLPTYPFKKERHWLSSRERTKETDAGAEPGVAAAAQEDLQSALRFVTGLNAVRDVAPRNDVERAVASVWEEALGIRDISVTDSFFELGGDSLLAAVVITRCAEMFNVDINWGILLSADPTIEGFAHSIVAKLADGMTEREWESVFVS